MTEKESPAPGICEAIQAFGDVAKDVLEAADFDVVVEEGSPEWQDFTLSKWPEFHWLAGLPDKVRGAVRVVWDAHETLGKLMRWAVGRVDREEKRARLESVVGDILSDLGRVLRPVFHVGKPLGANAARVRDKVCPILVTAARNARIESLDELVSKLGVAVEGVEPVIGTDAVQAEAGPAEAQPAAEEAADLAIGMDGLNEVVELTQRLEGDYVALVEELPLKEVKDLGIKGYPHLPALTPKRCYDWNQEECTDEQSDRLAEARSGYERIRAKLGSALGTTLCDPRPGDRPRDEGATPGRDVELPPGFGGLRASVLARQCDEALWWLGTILPVGSRLPRAWTSFASARKLRGFLAEKARSCFSLIRDAARTLQERVERLQAAAERRALAEERILAREAATLRLISEGGGETAEAPPRAGAAGLVRRFPTPKRAKWKDVTIRFQGEEAVRIRVRKASGVYTYAQMGMADKRSGKPTEQWKLLKAFADSDGVMDWSQPTADKKNQKRSEILARNLKAFFGIDEYPFALIADKAGWHARFTILRG